MNSNRGARAGKDGADTIRQKVAKYLNERIGSTVEMSRIAKDVGATESTIRTYILGLQKNLPGIVTVTDRYNKVTGLLEGASVVPAAVLQDFRYILPPRRFKERYPDGVPPVIDQPLARREEAPSPAPPVDAQMIEDILDMASSAVNHLANIAKTLRNIDETQRQLLEKWK